MSEEADEIRIVETLGIEMKRKLRNNAFKTHWKLSTIEYLRKRIGDELKELDDELDNCRSNKRGFNNEANAQYECADIANFCAMLYDVLGLIREEP